MVAPIVSKSLIYSSRTYSYRKVWNVQKPPYNLRLPCRLWTATADGKFQESESWSTDEDFAPTKVLAENDARQRFVSQLGEGSQIGTMLTSERSSTFSSLTNRVMSIVKFTSHLRKLQFTKAAKALNLNSEMNSKIQKSIRKNKRLRYSGGRAIIKDFGSLWLEYSYGLSPLLSDIGNALDILKREPPPFRVVGRAKVSKTIVTQPSNVRDTVEWTSKVQIIADVLVSNPNLYRYNQLGLTNPAEWVLEGLPFSFVLDWVSNLSDFVGQYDDFLGLDLRQAFNTHLCSYSAKTELRILDSIYDRGWKKFYCLKRSSGVPSVRLVWALERTHWKRALNAISLLTSALDVKASRR